QVALARRMAGMANPNSPTGRLDVFTRVIADGATVFDRIDAGYEGRLYIEVAPRTFSILVRKGSRLVQLRLRRGQPSSNAAALRRLQETSRLVDLPAGPAFPPPPPATPPRALPPPARSTPPMSSTPPPVRLPTPPITGIPCTLGPAPASSSTPTISTFWPPRNSCACRLTMPRKWWPTTP